MGSVSPAMKPQADEHSGVFADVLAKGEKLLWEGRPDAGVYAVAHLRAAFLGSVVLGFALLWHQMAARVVAMPQLDYATWPIVAAGLLYALAPVWAYVVGKHYVFYAMTDKRLVVMSTFPRHTVRDYAIKDIERVVFVAKGRGIGQGTGQGKGQGKGKAGTVLIDAPGAPVKTFAGVKAGFYGVRYAANLVTAVETLKNPQEVLKQAQTKSQVKSQAQARALGGMPPSVAGGTSASRRAGPFTPSSHTMQ